jgi:transcriptional regulator with AAA-type ATPase domain
MGGLTTRKARVALERSSIRGEIRISWRLMGADDITAPETQSRSALPEPTQIALQWVFPVEGPEPTRLRGSQLRIGRGPESALRLDFKLVSREHADIYRDGPVFALRDLDSRNGTFLNAVRITHATLALGDVLRIGDCVGVVTATPRSSALTELAPGFWGGEELAVALEPARRAARSLLPVLVVGETGTGKERLARAIHDWSGRSGDFHAVNCAALPEHLIETELFGHVKGAFTGATQPSSGRVRAAEGGTLLLDELVELPMHLQPKLLRLLEEGAVVPIGGSKPVPIDVRIVATTQVPLDLLVAQGKFRQDLRARLAGLVVPLAPLRARRQEIVPLFLRLLALHSAGEPPPIEAKLAEALCLYAWPDNVRELDLLVRRLLALYRSEPILRRKLLPEALWTDAAPDTYERPSGAWLPRRSGHDLEQLKVALQKNGGNIKAAAASLGFSRQRAYRLMAGKSVAELLGQAPYDLESSEND